MVTAFAELARKEIGSRCPIPDRRGAEAEQVFDLQMLYGASAEECAAIRTFEVGTSGHSAAARRDLVRFRRDAARAPDDVFSRNHNLIADHVTSAGDGSRTRTCSRRRDTSTRSRSARCT